MAISSLRPETPVISRLSNEPLWAPIRVETLGSTDVALTSATVKVAIVKKDPVTADWLTASLEASTWTGQDGETYYVVRYNTVAGAFPAGNYQLWVQAVDGGLTYVHLVGPVTIY
jgi:hypothetical protein